VVVRYWASGKDARKLFGNRFAGNTRAFYSLYIGDTKTDGWVKTVKRPADSKKTANLVALWGEDHLSISIFATSSQELWSTFG